MKFKDYLTNEEIRSQEDVSKYLLTRGKDVYTVKRKKRGMNTVAVYLIQTSEDLPNLF